MIVSSTSGDLGQLGPEGASFGEKTVTLAHDEIGPIPADGQFRVPGVLTSDEVATILEFCIQQSSFVGDGGEIYDNFIPHARGCSDPHDFDIHRLSLIEDGGNFEFPGFAPIREILTQRKILDLYGRALNRDHNFISHLYITRMLPGQSVGLHQHLQFGLNSTIYIQMPDPVSAQDRSGLLYTANPPFQETCQGSSREYADVLPGTMLMRGPDFFHGVSGLAFDKETSSLPRDELIRTARYAVVTAVNYNYGLPRLAALAG